MKMKGGDKMTESKDINDKIVNIACVISIITLILNVITLIIRCAK